ncbi:60S acidic ribosomal protein P1, partial [Bonamia ostreae]
MDSSDLTRSAVWEKRNGCSFGVYLPEEIRDISVKEITNIRNFDKMGEQVENGLYDPSLGPLSDFALCKTCKQRINHCPGHLGHIELKFMLYNPVLFNGLIRMLKLACLYCNKWRVGNDEIKTFYNKMEMIEKGELLKAQYYKTTKSVILDEFLKEENPVLEKNSKFQNNFTNEEKAIFRKIVVKEFYKQSTNKKCKNCDCINPTFENKNSTLVFKKLKTKQYNHNEELMEGKVIPEFLAENKDKEIMAIELRPYLKKFWKRNQKILSLFCGVLTNSFSKNFKGFDTFFITTLLVSPSKYRPINIIGNETLDNEKTICLEKIMLCNQKFVKLIKNFNKNGQNFSKKRKENNVKVEINLENGVKTENLNNKKNLENDSKPNFQNLAKIEKKAKNIILEAQSLVDDLFNSKNSGKFGVKQIIEKKTGIIRGNLMGKRVNYAARSIVSPDLWIESTEIGVPENFAKKLTFPESVTEQNIAFLKRSIENGPLVHPGANFIEDQNGYLIDLEMKSKQERKIMAGALTATQSGISDKKNISSILTSKRVYRHLDEKDYVLVNRQPTLHKASMMAHKVRILTSQDQVLRLHYTNCSTYNADFDGDEINMHFPQT